MLRLFSRLLYVVTLVTLLSGVSLLAQSATGRFSGQVTDTDGGAIPGASIQIINQVSLATRETKSDASGGYGVANLAPGRYQIVVEADGFARRSSDVIAIVAGQNFIFNVKMTVGGVQTEVQVSDGVGATTVDTTSASISTTLGAKEITGYGLNGRNFSQLITMAPGVSNQTGQDEAKVGVAGSAKFSVNGGRVEYNTFEVDGSDVLNTSINASRGQGEPLMVYPSIDAIQDMKVLTADYSALYGKSASGSVLVSTKSGAEKFHGNVYGFLRNEMFNARNYFDQPNEEPAGYTGRPIYRTPLYRRLDFGATLGGPLFIPYLYPRDKSKTYFFYSEEVRREKTPIDYNQAVPTMAERSGDFSDVCPLQVPGAPLSFSPSLYPDCPQVPQGGGVINVGRSVKVDYTSAAILNTGLIPEPNATRGCDSTNPSPLPHCYVASISPPTHWREELFRIDHDLTAKQRLSFRYVHDSWDTVTLAPQWGVVHNSFATIQNQLNGPGLNMSIILSQSLPHGITNLVSASYAVEHISLFPQPGPGVASLGRTATLDDPAATGGTNIPGVTQCAIFSAPSGSAPSSQDNPAGITECPMGYIFANNFGGNKAGGMPLLPGLNFQGNNGAYGGHGFASDTGYAPWSQANPTFTVRDDASKIVGKHNLQWGFWGSFVQQNELSGVTGANSGDLQGLLTFSNEQSIYTTGNAFADFLGGSGFLDNTADKSEVARAGGIKSFTQDSGQVKYYTRNKTAEFYLQDDWRAASNLTINFGLRASLLGAWYNPKGTAYNWRPELFNPSFGSSITINQNLGNLTSNIGGSPLTLPLNGPYSLNSLGPVIANGLMQCASSCMTNSLFHPSPRVGFSWDPWGDGKTAIHGGYGLFWEHGTGYEANVGSLIGSAPLVLSETQSNIPNQASQNNNGILSGGSAYNLIGLSCQAGVTQCIGNTPTGTGNATFPLNVTSIPTKAVYSYVQQWSFSVQREVRKGMVGQFAYVGTKGTHLTAVSDLNQLQPLSNGLNPFGPGEPITAGVCNSGANFNAFSVLGANSDGGINGITVPSSPAIGPHDPGYQNMFVACTGNPGFATTGKLGISADAVRPYRGFSNIISVQNVADSEYDAFQATLRETTGPLTIGVAYTYSHSLDDASDRSSANFANSLDIHSNHASSDFDQRHLLNVSYIYDLPFLRLLSGFTHIVGSDGDPSDDSYSMNQEKTYWQPGSLLKTIIGGWQLSGITAYETGTPFSVINGGGADGTGAADNAGVGDGLGVGSYADVIGKPKTGKPFVAPGGNNIGPLLLNPGAFAAPRGLTFGDSGRNYLRNPTRVNFNMSMFKHFKPFQQKLDIEFRVEAFNVFNHTQFRITDPSNPGNTGNNVINCYGTQTEFYSAGASSCLQGNSFLHPVDAHDPRILQFGLKGNF